MRLASRTLGYDSVLENTKKLCRQSRVEQDIRPHYRADTCKLPLKAATGVFIYGYKTPTTTTPRESS